jgi:hypothetical protein
MVFIERCGAGFQQLIVFHKLPKSGGDGAVGSCHKGEGGRAVFTVVFPRRGQDRYSTYMYGYPLIYALWFST